MASLIGWVKKKAQQVENGVSRVVDQVNPLDGGRTYQQRTPTRPQASAVQQATHNGATNFAGAIVKPAIRSGMAVTQGIGNAEVGIAHMLGKAPQVHTLNGQQFANQSIGRNLNRAVDFTGTKRQIIGDAVSNVANFAAPGESKVLTAGAAKLVPKAAPKVVAKFAPKIAANAVVGAGMGAASNTGSYIASNQPITAKNLAKTAGTGAAYGAAFGAALPVAIPAAKVAGKATVTGAKAVDKEVKAANLRLNQDLSAEVQQRKLNTARKELQNRYEQGRAAGLPDSHPAQRQAVTGLKQLDQQQMSIQGATRTPRQKVTDKILTAQPGMSMRAVNPANDPLQALKQEALKYKSADEFVNSHSPVYHGTNADLTDISQLQSGRQRGEFSSGTRSIFASENPNLASAYGKNVLEGRNTGKVLDTTKLGDPHDPNNMIVPKEFSDYTSNPILDSTDRRVLENSYFKGGTPSNIIIDHKPNIQEYFRSKGYSAIQIPRGSDVAGPATEMSIIDHGKIQSRQQLTDLYNQAHTEAKPTAPVKSTTPKLAQPKPAAKLQLPASRGTGGESLPNSTPKVNNSLTQGAKDGRQNLSPETSQLTQGKHDVRNTQNLADTSQANVDALPTNVAIEQAHSTLAQPLGHVTDEQTGFVAKTIEKADAAATKARQAGNTVEADRLSREAAALHDGLSEHAVARGQANQALTMLYNRSPQGLYHSAIRDLNRAGVEVTPELQTKLQGLTDAIKTAPDRATKTDALGNFHKAVSDTMPQNIGDKAMGIWKAGLLSGVKTQQGNAISNATFGALKKVSDVPATVVDKLMSVFTGKRTKTLTGRGIGQGTAEGTRNAKYTMKTGVDRRGAGDKYEQHAEINFKHPVLNKTLGTAVRTVFRGMNAADQPFWYAAFKNSMYDQAKAAGVTKGLKGAELKQFMEETVKNPNDAMANTALKEANKSTLNYDTLGSKAVQGMHTAIDKFPGATNAGKNVAHGVINVLAPFVRVPTAFLSRTVDFTPMGVGKEIFHQVASGKFDQRALSQAIGEGITGTGVIALGVALTQHDMLSGDYPKNDPKEAQRWKAEGIQPNSVKIYRGKDANGKDKYTWMSLNYLGPLGLLFNAGNKLENAKGQGSANQAGQAIAGFGQGLMGQSFLQGFSGFSNAIQDPQRNLKSFVNSQVGSIIPNISNDVANATDSMQRQANNAMQTIQSRIPGARHGLPVKQDVYGNPLKQPAGPLGTLIGVKPSNSLTVNNPVTSEVSRLHGVDPNNNDLQVTPTPITSVTIPAANKGDKSTVIKLNDKQKYAIQKQVGQNIQSNWSKLIKTSEYQAMSDTEKAKALTNMRTDTTELATRKYVVDNNLGSYAKAASKASIALANGDMSKYTDGTSAVSIPKGMNGNDVATLKRFNAMTADQKAQTIQKEPDAQYKLALANYERDKHTGTKTQAELQSEESNVFKAQVGSQFDKEVRDVYGMSKPKATAYLANNPNGNNLANAVIQYGDSLAQNGIENNKFVDSKGNVGIVPKGTTIEAKSGRISATAQKNGIPDNIFAALVKQESGGNQGAKSPVGAIGLTQLMPATAKALGVDPNNADQNLDGGARYLKQMYDKFGRWDYALAAYNAGPGAVEKYKGIPPFTETQNYVKSILGMVKGGIKGDSLNLVLNDPNAQSGGALNQSGVNTASTSSNSKSASLAAVFNAAKAGQGTNSLTKARTSAAPSTKAAGGTTAYKRPPLKKYNVTKAKVNLNKLARLA